MQKCRSYYKVIPYKWQGPWGDIITNILAVNVIIKYFTNVFRILRNTLQALEALHRRRTTLHGGIKIRRESNYCIIVCLIAGYAAACESAWEQVIETDRGLQSDILLPR